MTCSVCHKPAHDNAVAYYTISVLGRHMVKCWFCLTPAEKAERDPGTSDRVRFELIKSLRTK